MSRTCEVPGCDLAPYKGRAICSGHQTRRRRHGDALAHVPLKHKRPPGSGSMNNRGYLMDYFPGHPLAMSDGRVLRHRVRLFNAIGAGEHACAWCGCRIAWMDWGGVVKRLVADHLDGDLQNNECANLVPACPSCNTARGNMGNPIDWRRTR